MKIFGIEFTTKKELRETIAIMTSELAMYEERLCHLNEAFPFDIGQTVYDVALKNDKGRYTKTKPSLEHSTITEVVVEEKNYFSLVKRLGRNDVFFNREAAEKHLRTVCK